MIYICTNSPIRGRQYSIVGGEKKDKDNFKVTLVGEPALEGACVIWLDHYFRDSSNRKYIFHSKNSHHHLGIGLYYHYYAESVDPEPNEDENNSANIGQESMPTMEQKTTETPKRIPFIAGEPVIFADSDFKPIRMFRGITVGENDVDGLQCTVVEFVGEAKNVYAQTHGIFAASSLYFPKRVGSCP